MAFPTLFRIVADLIGIGAGVATNQPYISPKQNEHLEALSCRHNRSDKYTSMSVQEREALSRYYWDKFKRSNIDSLNRDLSVILQRELRFNNFDYAERFFKRYFPDLD